MERRLLWRTDSSWHSWVLFQVSLRQCWVFLCIIYAIFKEGLAKIAVLQEHFDLIVKSCIAQVKKNFILFLLVFWKGIERWVVFSAGLSFFIPALQVPWALAKVLGGLDVDRDVRRMLQMLWLSSPWLPVSNCNWLWHKAWVPLDPSLPALLTHSVILCASHEAPALLALQGLIFSVVFADCLGYQGWCVMAKENV